MSSEVSAGRVRAAPGTEAGPTGDATPIDAPWLAATLVAAWIVSSLLLVGIRRYAAWDEAVYIAKGLGPPDTISWGPQRSLGVPIITSTVTWWQSSVVGARLPMMLVNGVAAFVALRTWQRLVGVGGLIGPGLVLFSWLGLFSAGEIYPNLPTGLLALWAIGALWLASEAPTRSAVITAGVPILALGLIRPTALGWLFIGIIVASAAPMVRARARTLLTIFLATSAVGLVPWTVESFLRFGDPLTRLRSGGSTLQGYDVGNPVAAFVKALADQPLWATLVTSATLPVIGALLVAGAVGVYGLVTTGRSRSSAFAPTLLVTAAGVAKLVAYLLIPSSAVARFMVPGLMMMSVAVGVGVAALWRHRVLQPIIVVAVVAHLAWHASAAQTVARAVTEQRAGSERVGAVMSSLAGDRPCAFESRFGFPVIQLRSGCTGARATDASESLDRLDADARHVFVAWVGEIEVPDGWRRVDDPRLPPSWTLLERPSVLPHATAD